MSFPTGGIRSESPSHRAAAAAVKAAVEEARVPREKLTYAGAGVNVAAGEDFVDRIKAMCISTAVTGVSAELGGYGVIIDTNAYVLANGIKRPITVLSCDGVGTKLMIAEAMGVHDTVGIDLVAMSVNDVLAEGAAPLAFLDYLATGKLNGDKLVQVVKGIAEGCRQAGCALAGGETAEMPGMYEGDKYDLAGFATGIAEFAHLPRKDMVQAGDVLIGLSSSGLHSNGFSLIRRLLPAVELTYHSPVPFTSEHPNVGMMLLEPTRIYVKPVLPVIRENLLLGVAHITGGGLLRNVARVLPEGLSAVLDATTWPTLPVFSWIAQTDRVALSEMAKSLNLGLGMVLVVPADDRDRVLATLKAQGETACVVGQVVTHEEGTPRVVINNMEQAFRPASLAGMSEDDEMDHHGRHQGRPDF